MDVVGRGWSCKRKKSEDRGVAIEGVGVAQIRSKISVEDLPVFSGASRFAARALALVEEMRDEKYEWSCQVKALKQVPANSWLLGILTEPWGAWPL